MSILGRPRLLRYRVYVNASKIGPNGWDLPILKRVQILKYTDVIIRVGGIVTDTLRIPDLPKRVGGKIGSM